MSVPKEWEDFAHPYPTGVDVTKFGATPRSVPEGQSVPMRGSAYGKHIPDPAARVIAERDEEIRRLKAHANTLADRLRDWDRWWQVASGTLARSGMVCKRTEIVLLAHDAIVNKPRPERGGA